MPNLSFKHFLIVILFSLIFIECMMVGAIAGFIYGTIVVSAWIIALLTIHQFTFTFTLMLIGKNLILKGFND